MSHIDMGGVRWPLREQPDHAPAEPFAATVDKNLLRPGEVAQVTGKSGQATVTDFEVGVQPRGSESVTWTPGTTVRPQPGIYRLSARRRGAVVSLGNLRVL